MKIKAAEISSIIKEQIKNFDASADISEVGTVLSVGDGIARQDSRTGQFYIILESLKKTPLFWGFLF